MSSNLNTFPTFPPITPLNLPGYSMRSISTFRCCLASLPAVSDKPSKASAAWNEGSEGFPGAPVRAVLFPVLLRGDEGYWAQFCNIEGLFHKPWKSWNKDPYYNQSGWLMLHISQVWFKILVGAMRLAAGPQGDFQVFSCREFSRGFPAKKTNKTFQQKTTWHTSQKFDE